MKKMFLMLAVLGAFVGAFVISGCGSSPAPMPIAQGPTTPPAPPLVSADGVLDLGTSGALVTSASDNARPNRIVPSSMNGVSHVKKVFTFNSRDTAKYFFDATWNYGLCEANGTNSQYPQPEFYLDDGVNRTKLLVQYPFAVKPHHDYKVIFELRDIHCADQGFDAEFSLRREN